MLEFGEATPYWTVAPGTYELEVQDPETGDDVMDPQHVALSAGTSWTGVVVGGGGEKARTLLLSDLVSAPTAAPQCGFGGLHRRRGTAVGPRRAGGAARRGRSVASRGGRSPPAGAPRSRSESVRVRVVPLLAVAVPALIAAAVVLFWQSAPGDGRPGRGRPLAGAACQVAEQPGQRERRRSSACPS